MADDIGVVSDEYLSENEISIDLKAVKDFFLHPSIFVWTLLSIVIGIILLLIGIPMPSSFALHLPIIYLPLLIFIPLIIIHSKNQTSGRGFPEFKDSQVLLLMVFGSLLLFLKAPTFYQALNLEFLLLFAIPFFLSTLVFKIHVKDLGFRGNLRDIMYAITFGLIYCAMVFFLVGLHEFDQFMSFYLFFTDSDVILSAIPLAFAVCSVAIALPEEFLFRSILQSKLVEKFGTINGILSTSLVFGLFHSSANFILFTIVGYDITIAIVGALMISFIAQAQIGIILGVAWQRTKSLLLPISLHTGHNIAEMLPVFISLMFIG